METFKTIEQGLVRDVEEVTEGLTKIVIDSIDSEKPVSFLVYDSVDKKDNLNLVGKFVVMQEEVDSQLSKNYNNRRNQRLVIGDHVYNLTTTQKDAGFIRNQALKENNFTSQILKGLTYIG